jgi:hypothetical protein
VGRYRKRLLEDAENDLRKTEVKRWRQKGNSTEQWLSVVNEVKVLRGT